MLDLWHYIHDELWKLLCRSKFNYRKRNWKYIYKNEWRTVQWRPKIIISHLTSTMKFLKYDYCIRICFWQPSYAYVTLGISVIKCASRAVVQGVWTPVLPSDWPNCALYHMLPWKSSVELNKLLNHENKFEKR